MFIYIYMGDELDNIGNRVVIGTYHFFLSGHDEWKYLHVSGKKF